MSTKKVRVGYWLPPELAKVFRVNCAEAGRKQSEVIEKLIRAWIDCKIRLPKS